MSILLYAAGAIVVAIGAAMIAFGIPINEFSFGNTLIIAGTIAMVGGLLMLALGVVVRELRHVAEAYSRAPAKPVRPEGDGVIQARVPQPAAGRVPFPPKPKGPSRQETVARESRDEIMEEPRGDFDSPPFAIPASRMTPKAAPVSPPVTPPYTPPSVALKTAPVTATMLAPVAVHMQPRPEEEVFGAPALPNPDEAPVLDNDAPDGFEARDPLAEEDATPARTAGILGGREAYDLDEPPFAPARRLETPSRPVPPPSPAAENPEHNYFDAMWPADPRPPEREPSDQPPMADEPAEPEPAEAEVAVASDANVEEPRSVAILKSGVVDGMGYTLYVDGSIEAELPQGTLRFASINELRAHLERSA